MVRVHPGRPTFTIFCVGINNAALVAQMVERKTLNLVVVGSIPTEGVFLQLDANKLVMQH